MIKLKEVQLTITKELFNKKIPFCVYRFPNEKSLNIAIDEEYLPHPVSKYFVMEPFIKQSKAKTIKWSVLNHEFHNQSFLTELKLLENVDKDWNDSLPEETSKEQYFERIDAFLKDIRSRKLDKAIFSRVFYEFIDTPFDLFTCFENLCAAYPNTFVYLSAHPDSGVWLGATPELLMKKNGQQISIMALAGTQARKDESEYQWRDKEMEEHLMVGKHIEAVFNRHHAQILTKAGPHTIERGQVAHLCTDYIFEVSEHTNLQQLLVEIHPTPAIGGLPVDKGVECIVEHEGYDRAYYCGYLGETDFTDYANLYINLRNMQVGQDKIAIYVGGGITAASDPQEEWTETVMKSRTMLDMIRKK